MILCAALLIDRPHTIHFLRAAWSWGSKEYGQLRGGAPGHGNGPAGVGGPSAAPSGAQSGAPTPGPGPQAPIPPGTQAGTPAGTTPAVGSGAAGLTPEPRPVPATPRALGLATRASGVPTMAVGMGKIINLEDFLNQYPGSRTAILAYLKLDSEDYREVVSNLHLQDAIEKRMGRTFWPQVAIETSHMSLSEFRRQLCQPGSQVDSSVRSLAHAISLYREEGKWFFIRPFCEMNDATQANPWEFGNDSYTNTPEDFAAAWKLLRVVFDQEGATNAIFLFSPLAAYSVHREDEVSKTLDLIPRGYIDAFSLNVYSRPPSAYGGNSPEPIPFAKLVQPWLKLLSRSRHHGIPLAVAEMGVSNQATDDRRAGWLRDTFRFARTRGFVMVTYYNYRHPYWQIDDGTQAGAELKAEMAADPPPK